MPATIDYYFSLNSPWSYFGSARLGEIAASASALVRVKPMKIGAVFEQTGGLPLPKRSKQRQAYRLMELKRWSERLAIPITLEPAHFPSDETLGAHLVIAAEQSGGNALLLATEIGRALWERDENIADEGVLMSAAERAGVDFEMLRRQASEVGGAGAWEQNTVQAVSQGVFGAPTYVLGAELFWGQDRLDLLEWRLLCTLS